jgi:ABC-type branched-subunit amino acid transport system ATPase component/ABC-type branched-subunit amino acid transport system permease subunit
VLGTVGVSVGAVVLGLLNGLAIGLLAVGLVLVYKSNRFINLAHAQLGTVSALLVAKWVLDWHWNWWLAYVVAVGVGATTGLAVERLFVGPLRSRTRSSIRLLLLSLGISQLLLALTYVPALGPSPAHGSVYPQPFGSSVEVAQVTLTGTYVLTAVIVPILVAVLAVFMRRTLLGKQIRAAASNPDAARLCGVPVERVSAVTWTIAGGLSAVSAVLQAPTQPSFNVASLGPNLLMLTLGAAAFGAFVSISGALVGGILLGLARQLVSAATSSAPNAELATFVLILLVVLARGRSIGRAFETAAGSVEDPPVTRVPAVLRASALVKHQRRWLACLALLAGLAWPRLPWFDTAGDRFLLTLVLVYAVVGVALTVIAGWGGQTSLGHFAVVGIGAYVTARLSAHGWSLAALVLVAGTVGAVVLVAIGLPALRVRGLTLAVTTMGFAVITAEWLLRQRWLGSATPFGLSVEAPRLAVGLGELRSELAVYYTALGVLVLTVAAATSLRRSIPGRLFVAVRDNERASATFGFTPATYKLAALAVSGFFAGAAGVLWALAWKAVSPVHFTANVSLAVLAVPVIGGLGSVPGAVAAAVALYGGTFFVGPHVSSVFGDFGSNLGFSLFLAGAGVTLTLLKFPTGIAGAVQQAWQRYLDGRADAASSRGEEPSSCPALRVEGVSVRFGGVTALASPDIEVRPGEIVGLIGANGAGKTTLINVISGIVTPETGSVRLFGSEVVDLPPDLRGALGLGRGFQDATLFGGLTVVEALQVALARRHKVGVVSAMLRAPWVRDVERRTRREAGELAERFGLSAWADSRIEELSTGTRRVCELAALVAARPRVLLLDEPTAGVAQRDAEAFGPLLRGIRDELGCAVLIVEHDMPLLMGLCDRLYALEAGRVIAEGTPKEIRNHPRVVASYLGTDAVATHRSDGRRKGIPAAPVRSSGRSRRST